MPIMLIGIDQHWALIKGVLKYKKIMELKKIDFPHYLFVQKSNKCDFLTLIAPYLIVNNTK